MPVPYKPELFTVEEVENYFDISKGTCFRIYAGTNPKVDDYSRGEYSEGDKNVASQRLRDCLIALKQNTDNTNSYTLQVFNLDKKGNQAEKNCIIFQLNRHEKLMPYGVGMMTGSDPRLSSMIEKSIENQNLIISKLSAIEQPDEDEDDEQDNSVIGNLLKRDDVQSLLINGLTAVVSGLVNRYTPSPTYGGGVAGVNTINEESIMLLQELFNKGVNNDVLSKLNDMSEVKLKSLLLML